MSRSFKLSYIIAAAILTSISFAVTFLLYLACLIKAGDRPTGASAVIALLALSSLAVLAVYIVFALLCRFREWFDRQESCALVFCSALLFILLMLTAFPLIEPPYALIPRAEMGLSFLQLLIQIFTIAPAGICLLVSGLVFFLSKGK